MNSILFVFLASISACLSNLFFRKNCDGGQKDQCDGYLVIFYLFAFLFSLGVAKDLFSTPMTLPIVFLGGLVGILNIALLQVTARALTKGSAAMTFAFLNGSALMPGVLLFLSFGAAMGFTCSVPQLGGLSLVIFGLFLGAKSESVNSNSNFKTWLLLALSCFAIQVLALTCIQGRCVLFKMSQTHAQADVWFMPAQFGVALLVQSLLFLCKKRSFTRTELKFGALSGIANFGATLLLLMATKIALPHENTLIFPLFAVSTLVLCNGWATLLYKEKFHYVPNALCAVGIVIGLSA